MVYGHELHEQFASKINIYEMNFAERILMHALRYWEPWEMYYLAGKVNGSRTPAAGQY